MSKPVIGLTGGIACGKSTVARMLASLGAAVVDADALARVVVEPGSAGLDAVVRAFGPEVLDASGRLDRAKLGAIVFADAERRKQLEAITHPLIAMEGMRRIAEHLADDSLYVVYEAALLVETGRHTTFPALVVVSVSEATQRARLRHRDGLDDAAVTARLASQLPLAEKERAATWVIRNDADEDTLRREVERVHEAILARFDLAPRKRP